ncbi:MAG TPA: TraR/DksA C4-type zinc finger protein [Thermodesulfobacteriota bacterium]|nr:TraR/DksA C4-type zinc finger protein [Thermodesulfobacteriota bacterium]
MENGSTRHKKLKKYLLDRKMKLWSDLRDDFFRKLGKEYNTQFDNPHDIEELALIDIIEDMGIAVADIKRAELEQMDAALRKIEDGSYGNCEECGEEIEEERLKLIPFAEYCVKCKSSQEPGKKPTL